MMRKVLYTIGLLLITGMVLEINAQDTTVSGQVEDNETGEPLPGVNISIKGTNSGTTTNENGNYQLNVESLQDTLIFSFIGYETQNVPINGRTEISISLTSQTFEGEEMVIVGYGSQRKVNLTGAVSQVSGEEFENRSVTNVTQGLQGVIPNMNVKPLDGKPISAPAINIRGTTSIGQGGNALVLIDGVEGDLSMLNPDDIESISVLKDASSAAVYGARGAFGVVLVTTKNPAPEEVSITYSGSISAKQPTVEPDFVTDAYTYATMFNEGYLNYYNSYPQNVNKTLPFSQEYLAEIERRSSDPSLDKTWVADDGTYRYAHSTDWYDLLYKDRHFSTNHNLSVSRGTENTSFIVSGRYLGQEGLFNYNSDDYQLLNLKAKGTVDLYPWLQVSNNLDLSKRDYINPINVGDRGNIWQNIGNEGHPLAPMLNPDGTLTHSGAYTVGEFYLGNNNIARENRIIKNTTEFTARALEDHLEVRGNFTFQNTSTNSRWRRVPVPFSRAPGVIEYVGVEYNDLRETNDRTDYVASNLYTEYENQFSESHYFKAMVGGNYEQSTFDRIRVQRNGLILPDTENINLAFGEAISLEGGYERWQILGGFSRLNYIFDDRYLFEFNARYDGSSKFPENERYAFFPSASVGWRISQESFWKIPENIVNHLQLRASYGSIGNGSIGSYVFQETFSVSEINRIINGEQRRATSHPSVLPEGLTWETATTRNIGIDIEMLSGKLQASGDAYVRETTDMFTRGLTPPAVFGASPPFGNYADLETKGWEISLTWRDHFQISNKQFNYNVQVHLSDYQSEITRYNNPEKFLDDYYEGMKVGEIWGYETEGFFTDQEDIDNHADQSRFTPNGYDGRFRPGDVKFRDLNGDGEVTPGENTVDNPGDRKVIGNSEPRYSFGINLGANWNNIFISSFFQGVLKQDWYPSSEAHYFWGQYNRVYSDIPKWHLDDDIIWSEENPDSFFPRYTGYLALGGSGRTLQATQTKYVMNIAYIRLKNLQIGYNLPQNLLSELGMKNARIYLSGENLWSWSPLYRIADNVDIESVSSPGDQYITSGLGGDGNNYPRLSSVTLGISVSF